MKPRWIILPLALLAALVAVLLFRTDRTPGEAVSDGESADFLSPATGFLPYAPARPSRLPVDSAPVVPLPESHVDAIPDEYTVAFSDPAAMQAFLDTAAARGITILGTLPELMIVRIRAGQGELAGLVRSGLDLDANTRVQVPVLPDPEFWEATNLRGFRSGLLDFLGVPRTGGRLDWGAGVTIAILDTGWTGHAAMDSVEVRLVDLLDDAGTGAASPHGNAVAGLIASTHPYAPGIAPASDLLAIRVLDGNGQGNAFVLAEGIIEAVHNGADVVNMSLGSYSDSEVLRRAVAYAESAGLVMVAAGGNDGIGAITYPAAYPEVIGVSAVDANGNRVPFANFGTGLDVVAPGYQVPALWEGEDLVAFDGTSVAAPMVSAMAARLLQTGAAETPAAIRQLIRDQANDTGPPGDDPQYGAGILNAERLETTGQSGIFDIALADLYPAAEESDGTAFPLYVTLENRGTDPLPEATLSVTVNGSPYHYRFSGLEAGDVQHVAIPVLEAGLDGGQSYSVSAEAGLPGRFSDARPSNNSGQISLSRMPGN